MLTTILIITHTLSAIIGAFLYKKADPKTIKILDKINRIIAIIKE